MDNKFIRMEIDGDTPKIELHPELSYIEGISMSLHQTYFILEAMALSTIETIKKEHPELEEDEIIKGVKANIYDKTVMMFSELMNKFFPEAEELDKYTPEELLNHLDEKIKELNELKNDAVSEQAHAEVSDM